MRSEIREDQADQRGFCMSGDTRKIREGELYQRRRGRSEGIMYVRKDEADQRGFCMSGSMRQIREDSVCQGA